jgi:glc operon protein GlcG
MTAGLLATAARGQEGRATGSDVRDTAKMFSADAVSKAKAELEKVERSTGVATMIETVDSIGSDPIDVVLSRHARRWGKDGIFILVDKKDRKFLLGLTGRYSELLSRSEKETVRDAFLAEFKNGHLDAGLLEGVKAIAKVLEEARKSGKLVTPDLTTGLVVRNQVRLSLAGSKLVVSGCEAKAAELKLKVNVAVVDDGGHLLAFERMDGARPASGYTAITKATTAATFRQETGPLPKGATSPDVLLNLSLQNAAAASGGKITTLYGGVPIVVDGQVVGGVGIGGGTGEQDAEVAKAGVARLTKALDATRGPDEKSAVETAKPGHANDGDVK